MHAALVAVLLACTAVVPVCAQQDAAASETPAQFFIQYTKAVSTATALEQLVGFWTIDQRERLHAADPTRLHDMQAFFKSVSGFRVLQGSARVRDAIVEAEGAVSGTINKIAIRLTRENDEWRVSSGFDHWR